MARSRTDESAEKPTFSVIYPLGGAGKTLPGYEDQTVDKTIAEHVEAVGGTMTTAGSGVKGMTDLLDFAEDLSPLGNATADDCADYCITLFSDLTRKITMQNLFNDGGFSSMGMGQEAIEVYLRGKGKEA